MATLRTRKKIISEFKDAKLSYPEMVTLLALEAYYGNYDPFNNGDRYVFADMLRGLIQRYEWQIDLSHGYPSNLCRFGSPERCYNCDREYRYELSTSLSKDRQSMQVLIKDYDDEDDVVRYVADLTDDDFFDFLMSMEFEGPEEEWNEVED